MSKLTKASQGIWTTGYNSKLAEGIKQRFREAKLGPTDYSLLHLAAKHNRQK